jgi:hypothetical protein
VSDDQSLEPSRSAVVLTRAAALLLFVFGVFPLANTLSAGEAVPWYRHALLVWILVGGTLLLLLSLVARVRTAQLEALWLRVSGAANSVPWSVFVGAFAVLAFGLCAWLAVYCFGRQPHSADEVAQLFHAKILLNGQLTLPPDPNPEFFQMDVVISGTRWYSQFPIGGPAILAIGQLFHAAWLLNPLLIGLSLVSTAAFARRIYGDAFSRAVAVLFALCPFALMSGASFMNHVPTMWLVSVATWQLAKWSQATSQRKVIQSAACIGLAMGVAFTVRPLDALAAAAVIGAVQVSMLPGAPERMRSMMVVIIAGLIPVAILFAVNARTNGAPTTLGYEVLYGNAHRLGFHADPFGSLHTVTRGLRFASKYLLQLNVLLFEWPVPAVAIMILGLVLLKRPSRWDLLVIGMLFAEAGAYVFYWHDGIFRGPRFLFAALPAIIILTARAPFLLVERLSGSARVVAAWALPVFVLFAWSASFTGDSVPGRIRQYRSASPVTRVDPDSLARANNLHNALVLINEGSEARNLHLLWSLGMSRGDASRLMVSASSCAVRQAIDAEERITPPNLQGRRDRLIRAALSVDPRIPEPAACASDEQHDAQGTAPFSPFFAANEIDQKGRIAGDVIYALDLGPRNSLLRERFGNRTWYSFGARRIGNTTSLALTRIPVPAN